MVEVHCTYDPASRGGNSPDGRKVKSTIHWVSAAHAVDAEVRIYENLFIKENPGDVEEGQDFTANLNPNSLEIISVREARTFASHCGSWQPLSVRTPGIFLRRSGRKARQAGVQPHGGAEGYLGEGGEETGRKIKVSTRRRYRGPLEPQSRTMRSQSSPHH